MDSNRSPIKLAKPEFDFDYWQRIVAADRIADELIELLDRVRSQDVSWETSAGDTAIETQSGQAGAPLPETPPRWGSGWTADDYFDWMYRRKALGFGETIVAMGKTAVYTGFYERHKHYKAQYGERPKPDDESRFKPG